MSMLQRFVSTACFKCRMRICPVFGECSYFCDILLDLANTALLRLSWYEFFSTCLICDDMGFAAFKHDVWCCRMITSEVCRGYWLAYELRKCQTVHCHFGLEKSACIRFGRYLLYCNCNTVSLWKRTYERPSFGFFGKISIVRRTVEPAWISASADGVVLIPACFFVTWVKITLFLIFFFFLRI